jgi:hypothetical protein
MGKRHTTVATQLGLAGFDTATVTAAQESLETIVSLLHRLGDVPTDTSQWARELVVAALFRRSIVMAQSIGYLAIQGQIEGCVVLMRTMLEVGLSLRIVLQDKSNRMAKRLAAHDYRSRQRYHAKALSDPSTRADIEELAGEKERFRSLARSWRDQLQLPFFDEVREELERDLASNRGWHGLGTISEAFEAMGLSSDYYRQYNMQSPFTHGSNIEWDWDKPQEDPSKPNGIKPMLRSLFEPSTNQMRLHLGLAIYRAYEAARTIVEDQLSMHAIPDRDLNERRKGALRSMKVELIELLPKIHAALGPDPLNEYNG